LVNTSINIGTKEFEKFKLIQPSTTLLLNEFMAVYFYTLQWGNDIILYNRLNKALIDKTRKETSKWKYFLYYFFDALKKIPKVTDQKEKYRSVNLNVQEKYPEKYKTGQYITWYTFTSTTINPLSTTNPTKSQSDFFNPTKPHTIFKITESFSGRFIKDMSAYPQEDEILFPPLTTFKIESITKNGLCVNIELKQIKSDNVLGLE